MLWMSTEGVPYCPYSSKGLYDKPGQSFHSTLETVLPSRRPTRAKRKSQIPTSSVWVSLFLYIIITVASRMT